MHFRKFGHATSLRRSGDNLHYPDLTMFIGFRPVQPGDDAEILRLLDTRADYFAARGTRPHLAHALLTAIPEGTTAGQKRLLAIESDGVMVGLVDAVVDYPDLGVVSLALFLLEPGSDLHGFGVPVASLLVEHGIAEGMFAARVECPVGWAPGENLLRAMGYRPGESTLGVRTWSGDLTPPPFIEV
ncbi:MAG: hypothetical protein V4479_08630 [Actinomycetota bacterium]